MLVGDGIRSVLPTVAHGKASSPLPPPPAGRDGRPVHLVIVGVHLSENLRCRPSWRGVRRFAGVSAGIVGRIVRSPYAPLNRVGSPVRSEYAPLNTSNEPVRSSRALVRVRVAVTVSPAFAKARLLATPSLVPAAPSWSVYRMTQAPDCFVVPRSVCGV